MASFTIYREHERRDAIDALKNIDLPATIRIDAGRDRSLEQNALMWKWNGEVSRQSGEMSPAELHTQCKLNIGIPIILADPTLGQSKFCEVYLNHIEPLGYEEKLAIVEHMPVTSMMTTKQMAEYLNAYHRIYAIGRGYRLTNPDG